jgi:NAD(P)H-dependent FMN reductase
MLSGTQVVSMVATAGSAKHYLIPQQQLQPILSYMKAQVVQPYAFVEEKDLHRNQIVNDDVIQRLDRLCRGHDRAHAHLLGDPRGRGRRLRLLTAGFRLRARAFRGATPIIARR